jgi:hypothetical protein
MALKIMSVVVFWVVSSLVGSHQLFGGTYRLHIQGDHLQRHKPEDHKRHLHRHKQLKYNTYNQCLSWGDEAGWHPVSFRKAPRPSLCL